MYVCVYITTGLFADVVDRLILLFGGIIIIIIHPCHSLAQRKNGVCCRAVVFRLIFHPA